MYWGRDTCGIISLWVIFEVLIAVSVKRAVILIVTPSRLIEIYHPFFFYHEVRGGRFHRPYGGNRASCFLQNICKILPEFISRKMKFLKHWGTVTDVQQHVPCSPLMDEWDSVVTLNIHPFNPRGKIAHSGNLYCTVLRCKRNVAFQRPYTKTEVHQAVLQHSMADTASNW